MTTTTPRPAPIRPPGQWTFARVMALVAIRAKMKAEQRSGSEARRATT